MILLTVWETCLDVLTIILNTGAHQVCFLSPIRKHLFIKERKEKEMVILFDGRLLTHEDNKNQRMFKSQSAGK